MKAQETGFDPDFLSMILSELAEGGVLEQLRADGPQENLWKRIQARRKVAKNIRSTLVKIIIKSANDDFLMKVYKDGWIGVCAVARLEFYCAKRNRIRTNSRDNTPAHAA
jgi:ABC-type molybdate transport system ATPase subunit